MKIVIVGGNGFVGRPLGAGLAERYAVEFWDLPEVDVCDRAALAKRLGESAPDVVVNLAAVLGGVNSKNVSEILEVNFWGNQQVVEACREQGVRRFVFASSLTVHGENERGRHQTLNSPFRPKHAYGVSKAAAELALMQYARLFNMSIVTLRPTMILGDTAVSHAPIEFISSLLAGKDIEIFGTGEHEREWLWIDDAVDGFARAAEFAATAEAGYYPFFLTANRIAMADLAEKCAKRLGGKVRYAASEARAFTLTSDPSETEQQLVWRPRFDIDAMIEKLIPIVKNRTA